MLTNKQIDQNVRKLVSAYAVAAGGKTRPADEPVIEAGVALVVNLPQNINDIAKASGGDASL